MAIYTIFFTLSSLKTYGDKFDLEELPKIQKNILILLSITDEDFKLYLKRNNLEEKHFDMFPLIVASQQLCGDEKTGPNKKNIELFIKNFKEIPNSKIKSIWTLTIMYFGLASEELINYYKNFIENDKDELHEFKLLFGDSWYNIENQIRKFNKK